ncbi:MAG: TatD family hydrolase [bacterium]|nr:TatD family hydrolase [bacterium]
MTHGQNWLRPAQLDCAGLFLYTTLMIIDAHSHLQLPEFDTDRAAAIARMRAAGVKTITVGVDDATSRAALTLAEKHPDCLWATAGTHPADGGLDSFNIDTLRELAAHPKAVGIGECGLDYYRLKDGDDAIKEKQKEVFRAHIAIAEEFKKPLMIHCRPTKGTDDAYEDLLTELSNSKFQFSIIVHFFVGSRAVAERLLALGCYFTFGGVITFARDYDEAITVIPMERIMAETDAPFVAPVPYRGKRNEPAYVGETVKKLAELKSISFEESARITAENARVVFRID